jgi:DNA-directed RNA polymerase beta' subunit
MSIYKELSYDNYIEQVKSIRFCILGPNDIRKMSVAEIIKNDSYLGTEPIINGLFDPRMGVLDHNKFCHTCEQKNTFCPGHFGHINLAKPVFYIQFFDIVRKLLKCVCFRCSKLLLDPESPQVKAILNKKYTRQKRWEMMYKLCSKVRRCGQETLNGCKAKQPDKVYREPIVKIVMEWKDLNTDKEEVKKQVLNAEEVMRILMRITDEDAEILGFHRKYNRPEWMICTVLPVPPPTVRPSIRSDTGLRSEDDLTHKLCDIIKNNNNLKAKIEKGASKEQIDIATQVLQYHVATFIDNNIPGINPAQQRTGRLLKSLTERLKSKEGRIRGNLMGKRVDFSARSVITPDPNISIDELGVPIKIAMNITFPEVVNKYNKEQLTQYVRNGPDVYPGAKCLRQGNRTFLLKNKDRTTIELKDGDIVERHMINGDYVLFNRQPSLHRMSMMGHRVVVMPFHTFRSNPSVCPCFNSDYDGDEMNIHMPQSIITMNELVELAAVPTQIISPRECKPIIAIVQDVPLGVYRLTKSHVFMNQKMLFNLMSLNPRFAGYLPAPAKIEDGVPRWSGRQVLSTIIPKNINIRTPNKSFTGSSDNENYVVIENGQIKQGIVDKLIYQNRTKGLIHSIFNECGSDETRMFFDNTQRICCDWLVNSGFSVGISDLIVNNETNENLKKVIHDMKVKVYNMIADVHTGKFDNRSISNNNDYFEEEVNKILNRASSEAGQHGLSTINDITNRMMNMIRSQSKGNIINVAQMIACLGQVNVEGKRIAYGFQNRTLPHYTQYDDGPESRGFIQSSFVKGLNPQEFFFHSEGGREGLIDTAVKSVTRDTKIIIIENNKVNVVCIGLWIDQHMERCKDRVQYKEEKHTELLELDTEVYIPDVDVKGNVQWSAMKYVTRHDPDHELYEVTTMSGRKVTVTQHDSMLVWDLLKQEFVSKPTGDIKPGEFVPVTAKLPAPPVLVTSVRAYGDHDIMLNKEFGVMMGLYLACGSFDHYREQISFNFVHHESIFQSVVKSWFMQTGTENSVAFAKFLDELVGGGKHVPEVAFCALNKFVTGFLSGIFASIGVLTPTSLCVSCASETLIHGIALLCSRFGSFGKIHQTQVGYMLELFNHYSFRLFEKLDLIIVENNTYLQEMMDSSPIALLENDVVLDAIKSIVPIDATAHPKVYDVTVPGTYNFVLFNGLGIKDTSETGYLQRKLVKAMEDCKVNYDHTVRNASGTIIQFLYGEDGMDPTKIESQMVPYIEMDFATLHKTYNLTAEDDLSVFLDAETLKAFTGSSGWEERFKAHFQQIRDDRDYMIHKIFNKRLENNVMYPVSFQRIITNTRAMFKNPGMTNLSPLHVLDEINKLCDQVYVSKVNKGNLFFQILMRAYLSPKRVLMEYKFDKTTFDYLLQMIRMRFYDSIAHPSEMVGVISAQSIGEPCTQLSLKESSLVHILNGRNEIYKGTIGQFIDDVLANNPDKVIDLGNDSVVMNLDENTKFSIIGVSNDEKTSWKAISQVSRHPAHGGMVRVFTRSGKTTCATLSHSFLKRTESSIVPVKGSDLKVGDRLPVARYIPTIDNPKTTITIGEKEYPLDKDFGWLLGAYLADGSTNGSKVSISKVNTSFQEKLRNVLWEKLQRGMTQQVKVPKNDGKSMLNGYDMSKYGGCENQFTHKEFAEFLKPLGNCYTKHIPDWVFSSNLEFIKGIISGYFDGDGSVNPQEGKQMIRSASVSETLTEDMILLCAYVGIFASKCLEVRKEEKRKNLHSVQISRKYARKFKEEIGLVTEDKAKALDDLIAYVEREEIHDEKELIDLIPELGNALAFVGKALNISGQSRRYKRYINKAAIGRRTLAKYIKELQEEYTTRKKELATAYQENLKKIESLETHLSNNNTRYIDLPPPLGLYIAELGSDLMPSKGCGQWAKLPRTTPKTLQRHIDEFSVRVHDKFNNLNAQYDSILPHMEILLQAANSDVVWDEIVKLEHLPDPGTYVYDFTVPGNDSFMVDCGVLVHNTLNSVEWHTEVLMDMDGKLERVKIGDFIDNQLEVIDAQNIENHSNDTKLGWIKEKEFKILSCDEEGKVDWKLVEAVTRHPPINEDGSHTLVKVVTKSGRDVTATKAKSFLKREDNKIVPVRGEDLKVGDFVPVSSILPVQALDTWDTSQYTKTNNTKQKLDENLGYFIGTYLVDGYCIDEHVVSIFNDKTMEFCKKNNMVYHAPDKETICIHSLSLVNLLTNAIGTTDKRIPAELLCGNDDFCKALLDGFLMRELSSESRGLLEDIQQLLTRYGYRSEIHDGKLLLKAVIVHDIIPHIVTKEHGEISIPRARLGEYLKNATVEEDKAVYQQLMEENVFYDEIISIEEVESQYPYVYDLTIKDTRNFNIYNGLCMRDTFHLSGVSSASKAVRGVPRIKELLSVTKNIKAPAVTIYLDETIRKHKNEAKKVLNSIQTTFFKNIVKSSKIYFDPDDFNTTIEDDRLFLATYKEFIKAELMEESTLTPWLLRMEFDKEKMKEFEITMMDVGSVIYDFYKDTVNCMFSDDSSDNIVMRIKLPESNNHDDIITELKALEKNIMENIIINGVRKINKVVMNNKEYKIYNEEIHEFESTNEWILETNGTNLLEVLGHKYVDPTRTISNDVNEIYEILGVEAARQSLYNEISDIIADADLYVNYRHISLLVDTMTNKGYLLSIDRHGINRVDIGPLAKCSFEEVTDMLVKAGIFAEVDKISGVSANIMLGQIPPYGTGDTEILIDEKKLHELSTIEEVDEDELEEKDPFITTLDPLILEDTCSIDNIRFNLIFPEKDESIKPINIPISIK